MLNDKDTDFYLQQFANQLSEVQKALEYTFKEQAGLLQALTHRSFLHEHRNYPLGNNERIEFLGDAVLELLATEFLFNTYPDLPEGDLTSIRAASVRTETLAEIIIELKINEYLLVSSGEAATGGREKVAILADVFEAVLGAMYLDGGLKPCQNLLKRVLYPRIKKFVAHKQYIDPKTHFQEIVQAKFKVTPEYTVVQESGPDHEKQFVCAVVVDGKQFATGTGASKKKAEEQAARAALAKLLEQDEHVTN